MAAFNFLTFIHINTYDPDEELSDVADDDSNLLIGDLGRWSEKLDRKYYRAILTCNFENWSRCLKKKNWNRPANPTKYILLQLDKCKTFLLNSPYWNIIFCDLLCYQTTDPILLNKQKELIFDFISNKNNEAIELIQNNHDFLLYFLSHFEFPKMNEILNVKKLAITLILKSAKIQKDSLLFKKITDYCLQYQLVDLNYIIINSIMTNNSQVYRYLKQLNYKIPEINHFQISELFENLTNKNPDWL